MAGEFYIEVPGSPRLGPFQEGKFYVIDQVTNEPMGGPFNTRAAAEKDRRESNIAEDMFVWQAKRQPGVAARKKETTTMASRRRAPRGRKVHASGEMQLYANPYDTSADGFYFDSPEDFDAKYEQHLPVEEYEIDFIDGTSEEAALFNVAKVNQANLHEWFDGMDQLKDYQMAAAYFLLANGSVSSFSEAVEKADQLSFSEGDVKAYAEQFIDDMGGPSQLGKETLENYFDYEAYARDMNYNGDAVEFEFGGTTYTADPNSV